MEENLLGHIVGYCGQYLCGSQELWGTKKTLRRSGFARGTLCRFNSVEVRGTRLNTRASWSVQMCSYSSLIRNVMMCKCENIKMQFNYCGLFPAEMPGQVPGKVAGTSCAYCGFFSLCRVRGTRLKTRASWSLLWYFSLCRVRGTRLTTRAS